MAEARDEAEPATEPASVLVQRRIEWADTDASGFWHNSAAFVFLEAAEVVLLERLGFVEDVYGRHPRVRIEADFLAPLRFRDIVDIEIRVVDMGSTSVTYAVEMRSGGRVCAMARFVAVLLDGPGGRPVPWSDEHRALLLGGGPQAPERLVAG